MSKAQFFHDQADRFMDDLLAIRGKLGDRSYTIFQVFTTALIALSSLLFLPTFTLPACLTFSLMLGLLLGNAVLLPNMFPSQGTIKGIHPDFEEENDAIRDQEHTLDEIIKHALGCKKDHLLELGDWNKKAASRIKLSFGLFYLSIFAGAILCILLT